MGRSLQIKYLLIGLTAFAVGVGFANQFSLERFATVGDGFETRARIITPEKRVSCSDEGLDTHASRTLTERIAQLNKRRAILSQRIAELNARLEETPNDGKEALLRESQDLIIEHYAVTHELDRLYDSAYGDGTTKLLYRQHCYQY